MKKDSFIKLVVLLISFILSATLFAEEYLVGASSKVYKQSVTASYYADKFHGRLTANGETFNMYAMTAAHKTLPFGTLLEVTNLANGKKVIVRVNDRGPFIPGREIDLSKGAAVKLDMIKSGTTKVRLVIIDKNSSTSTATTEESIKQSTPNAVWRIQIASYTSETNAMQLVKKLRLAGFDPKFEKPKNSNVVRVVLCGINDSKLSAMEDKLNKNGIYDYLLKREK